ncbi:MAG: YbhN family protein, partial [Flavisolibacter sp.]
RRILKIFEVNVSISIWDFFQASIVALFANQTIPSAGISGNAFFYSFLIKRKISASQIFSLIVIELLTFYAASEMIIVFVGVFGLTAYKIPSVFLLILLGGFLVFGVFAFFVSYIGRSKFSNRLYKKISSVKFIKKRLDKFLKEKSPSTKMKNPWKLFFDYKLKILEALLLQIFIFLADSFTIFALFYGLGVPVSYYLAATALMLTKIVSLLPVSPGALILYEGGLTYFFVHLNLPFGTSLLVTLLYRLFSFWMPMPVGFVLYKKLQKI